MHGAELKISDDYLNTDKNQAICICDSELVTFLYNAEAKHYEYNPELCVRGENSGTHSNTECCQYMEHKFAIYRTDTQCCDSLEGVQTIGSCN